jgi:hypothetical protein
VILTSTSGQSSLNLQVEGAATYTVHSAMGLGLGLGSVQKLVLEMPNGARARWRVPQITLVIDEVGFVGGDFFRTLWDVGRMVRLEAGLDMTGVQVVALGDFLQLGPMSMKERMYGVSQHQASPYDFSLVTPARAFACSAWRERDFLNIILQGLPRFIDDPALGRVVDKISVGYVDAEVQGMLSGMRQQRPIPLATALYCSKEVRDFNAGMQESQCPPGGQQETYVAADGPPGTWGSGCPTLVALPQPMKCL